MAKDEGSLEATEAGNLDMLRNHAKSAQHQAVINYLQLSTIGDLMETDYQSRMIT